MRTLPLVGIHDAQRAAQRRVARSRDVAPCDAAAPIAALNARVCDVAGCDATCGTPLPYGWDVLAVRPARFACPLHSELMDPAQTMRAKGKR